ncbi:MAG TPA: hypothetical protein PKN37_00410 [Mesotoga sp.]|uniref:hypothetical protein n=1 Tax=unclassified Mesotoga TaxID=1184398 RepID=UPI000CBDB8D6|nr:hypothetical protein [Mesotoga sp. UBA5847]MDD3461295.1 hypothetical protein [Mesotoga sp.]PNQ05917.1 hypothetical protein RM69_02325 [Mesotoga sp. SC_NapDC3]PXF35185.1 hypothetical protein EU77_03175 [Mesotoga sp. SC_NapDC]RAM61233.1 hypothetical protein DS66_06410 [Mesotoga sp. SC_3PWM13N19]HNU22692.1 hypothetical protein [Mesotoga sp.]
MKAIMLFLMVIVLGSMGFSSLIIDGIHYSGIESESDMLIYDGINAAYVISQIGKNSFEIGGNFSFISSASSELFYKSGHFNTVLKAFVGHAYDLTEESAAGLRVVSRVGLMAANFEKFGVFFSITPVVYVRVGFLSFGVAAGLELEQFFGTKTLPVVHAGGEITYRF